MGVKSIIDIDINDERFKKFVNAFNKYKEGVKQVGKAWDKAMKSIALRAAGEQDVNDQLKEQDKQLDKQRKKYDQMKKSAKEIADKMKETAQSLLSGTRSLIRWVGLGGIISGLLGAGGLWGLDRLAASVSDARRTSQGLGITTGDQQAFALNFSRYVDPNSNLQAIADAKADYSKRWAFSAMGVNPYGKDPAALAAEMALRAKSIFDKGDGSEQYAQAHGLLQFYSMDDLRRFHATSSSDLQRSVSDYGRDRKTFGALSDRTQKSWQDFSIQMDRAGLEIKSVFVQGLTPLIGPLKDLSHAVAQSLETFMKSDALKKLIPELGKAIQSVAEYLSSDQFVNDLHEFVQDFGLVTDAIVNGLRLLHLIPDGPQDPAQRYNNPDPYIGGDKETAEDLRGYKKPGHKGFLPWTTKKDKYDSYMAYFMAQGWTRAQAAGIVANLDAESGLDPNASNNIGGGHIGLAQWGRARQKAFAHWLGKDKNGFYRDPALASEADQLAFINYELRRGALKAAGEHLAQQTTPEGAARVVYREYEIPGPTDKTELKRTTNAVRIFVNNNTGGNANVQANQAAAF